MKKTVSIDGRLVRDEDAKISVLDHGLLYGDGLFEGIRVRAGRIFRLEQHLARLALGARAIGLELPFDANEQARIITDTVRAFGQKEAYLRLLVTRGEGPLGVDPTTCPKPTVVCIVAEIGLFSTEQRARGLTMITSSYRRPNPDVQDVAIKTLNYLGSALAKQEARRQGADEALLLNQSGRVAEAAVANIFALRGRSLMTPPALDGCLEGINRGAVLELARDLGFSVSERSLGRRDLFAADEVFLTGSGAGVVGVRSLDGRAIGRGVTGEVTLELERRHRALAESEGPLTVS
ncbi:MAG TPA: branched-chain-amino-acid transaminase [Polyangiaceae bacterium]|jgi:branched-chain amino acid aminotransferase|nr:branched-chain-amino-acid transaminase [Polyangiaceae bacterium]